MKNVVIVGAYRTPIGSFGGSLSSFSAPELGAAAITGLLKKTNCKPNDVQEVIMGCVLTAGIGQAPARQAALKSGLDKNTPSTTVNKVCASGMKAVMMAVNQIQTGEADVIVAGGMESMSNVPYYLPGHRNGSKLGHAQALDGIIKDGLWDVYNDYHMGNAGEKTAREMKISREDQDNFAIESYKRSQKATNEGWFSDEIIPINVKDRKGNVTKIEADEEVNRVNFDKLPGLRPVFEKDGTITAANASSINDGAAAILVMSEEKANELGLKPIAKIKGQASAAKEPEWFTTAPADAIPIALKRAGYSVDDVDLFEINEAFSVVSIANNQLLKLDPSKVNIHGGAVSIGHPIGCSGARIIVTLLHALKRTGGKKGCAGICNGGGGASAITVEML
ncbi:MAG: acetyl-CoA C-acyltransferase [Balneolia bacterium]|nr:acetyl-CoA C-acyltransferase [Balneolia bacterium]